MGAHDEYGKEILRRATKGAVELSGPSVEIDYGTESPARIDGAYNERIAIELEARTGKQVRGAILDLICHPYPKKLLVCMPLYMTKSVPEQCRNILARFVSEQDFQVVTLEGDGEDPQTRKDSKIVADALLMLEGRDASDVR